MLGKMSSGFQSPDGDFVYSDAAERIASNGGGEEFQSPDGDFVYSDISGCLGARGDSLLVSIP